MKRKTLDGPARAAHSRKNFVRSHDNRVFRGLGEGERFSVGALQPLCFFALLLSGDDDCGE